MKKEDIIVGEIYAMIEEERGVDLYIKEGALVKVVKNGRGNNLIVEDLSYDKCSDGVWWTSPSKLAEVSHVDKITLVRDYE